MQRRQLERLPEESANELLRLLLERRGISPPQMDLFSRCATAVSLSGPVTGPTWLAHLSAFSALRSLSLRRCTKLRDAHLVALVAALAGAQAPLLTLDLSGCAGLGDGMASALARLSALQALDLSGTAVGPHALAGLVTSLGVQLTSLALEDLPVGNDCCRALAHGMTGLRRLSLAGAVGLGDAGAAQLSYLSCLTYLDLSLTQVTGGSCHVKHQAVLCYLIAHTHHHLHPQSVHCPPHPPP